MLSPTEAGVRRFLRRSMVVQLATRSASGRPFVTPIWFVQDGEAFCERLDALTQLRGKQVVEGWKAQVRTGDVQAVVRDLLLSHYDPVYVDSMKRNFKGYAAAQDIAPKDRSVQAMRALAMTLVETPASASR